MTEHDREYTLALEALREEVRTGRDKERLRERLVMRGVAMGAVLGAAPSTAAALKASGGFGWSALHKVVACAVIATAVGVVAVRERAPQRSANLSTGELAGDLSERAVAPRFVQHAAEVPAESERIEPSAARKVKRKIDERADLEREIALLAAAASALRENDLARAARLLDQHEREFPAGFLRAERDTARARLSAAQSREGVHRP